MRKSSLSKGLFALGLCLAAPVAAVAAKSGTSFSQAEQGLLAAEDARFRAQIAKDAPAVARGMADELIYTHANGRVQTKAEYMAGVDGPGPGARSIETEGRIVRLFGNGGMIRGIRRSMMGSMTLVDSYLAVYVKRDGRWQLLAWQTSPVPGGAGGPPGPGRPPAGPATQTAPDGPVRNR